MRFKKRLPLIFLFGIGSSISALLMSLFVVYILGIFDPKFRMAPSVAFQLELLGLMGLSAAGILIFSCAIVVTPRIKFAAGLCLELLIFVAGFLYPALFKVIFSGSENDSRAHTILIWLFLLAYPLLTAAVIPRLTYCRRCPANQEGRHTHL
jgi:hypothetical protein